MSRNRFQSRCRWWSFPLVALATLTGPVSGQTTTPIEYTVALPAPQTQMVELSMLVPNVSGPTLDFALPVWRPGRYDVLDPSGTVRGVRADDGAGRVLDIQKIDKTTWRVKTDGASTVRVEYRVYANSLGDRTRHVDDTHAFLSGSSVFFYVADRRDEAIRVKIDAPEGWKVAGGLEHIPGDEFTLIAPDYDVLIDSPIEVGLHDTIEFEAGGKPHEIVIWGEADYDAEELIEDFTRIVESQAAIFGEMPYERYVFLTHVGAGMGGGTEHLNSTIMQTRRSALEDKTAYKRFLGLVSHEFFHTWNVKHLRPAGIQPYDFAGENYTKLLWVCEGTTSYYDDLVLVRTGLIKMKAHFKTLARNIGGMRDRPGTQVQSLEESSFDAWVKFTQPNPDSVNSTVNFYGNGSLVSLALDLELRRRTDNRISLDTLMRGMYERYPLGGGGYTPEDLVVMASELSDTDFDPFFAAHVRGTVVPDFESALLVAGLKLHFKPAKKDDDEDDEDDEDAEEGEEAEEAPADAEPPVKAYIGLQLGGVRVRAVLTDGPAYLAGLMSGDEIVALDGRRLASGQLDTRLEDYEPGATVQLHIMRRDLLKVFDVILGGKPDGSWVLERVKEPTETQMDIYESLFEQDWPGRDDDDPTDTPATAPDGD